MKIQATKETLLRRRLTVVAALTAATALAVTGLTLPGGGFEPELAQAASLEPYRNTALPFDVRAADLVSRMTLTEKAAQLRAVVQGTAASEAPAIARLGVPSYNYWNEALHGVARAGTTGVHTYGGVAANGAGTATELPTGLGLAASWNPDLVRAGTSIVGDEARAYANLSGKGLTYWSPTINMHRDPRWGRAEETYGEDPYLTAAIGGAFVEGMQGDVAATGYYKTIVTPKHYLANNSENNRHNGASNLTEKELREYYTPAFAELAGTKYGAGSLMTSYNAVEVTSADGTKQMAPQSANKYTVETMLRRTWGFDGFITSDCGAIDDVADPFPASGHEWKPPILGGASVTRPQAVAWTIKAGTDIDCTGPQYNNQVIPAIGEGLLAESDLDVVLTRVFTGRMRLGDFSGEKNMPYGANSGYTVEEQVSNTQHLALAQQASEEGVVLLKNQSGTLPLAAASTSRVAVVGYLGNEIVQGDYSPTNTTVGYRHSSYPLVGGREANVTAARGVKLANTAATVDQIPGVVVAAKHGLSGVRFLNASGPIQRTNADGSPMTGGFGNAPVFDYGLGCSASVAVSGWDKQCFDLGPWGFPGVVIESLGAGRNTTLDGSVSLDLTVPAGATKVAIGTSGAVTPATATPQFVVTATPTSGGTPVNLGTVASTLVNGVNSWNNSSYAAEVDVTGLTVGTSYTFSFLYYDPSTPTGLVLSATDPALQAADAIVAYVGTRTGDSAEEADRSNVDLPNDQAAMVNFLKANYPTKPLIVYIQAVGQVNVEPFKANADAILWSSYNGEYQGHTVGRIIYGQVNPSAKLPFTYYANISDLAETTDYTMTPTGTSPAGTVRKGRTYQYFTGSATYPFGYGLSYSTIAGSAVAADKTAVTPNDTVKVSATLTNTSTVAGQEVAQLYAVSPNASNPLVPDRQLKGFTKVALAANETKTVTIDLPVSDLWFWDDVNLKREYPTGAWTLYVGPSSDPAAAWGQVTLNLSGTLNPAIDQVVAVPDGVVLNTATPGNVIHADLSATRTDQSFYDLASSAVKVSYISSDPAVARVDQTGAVKAVGAGWAQITATVTADGTTKSTSFPVIVYDGKYEANGATLFADGVDFADLSITPAQAQAGVTLSAELVSGTTPDDLKFTIAPMDVNTAGATVSDTTLTATQVGKVEVTVVATKGAEKFVHAATVTVTATPRADTDELEDAVAFCDAQLVPEDAAYFTASSWAAYAAALAKAKALVGSNAVTPSEVDAALAALKAAIEGLTELADLEPVKALVAAAGKLVASDYSAASWAALQSALTQAQKLLANPADVSADAAAASVAAITKAIAGLNANAGQSAALQTLVNSVAKFDAKGYSAASWALVTKALAAAKQVLANPNATPAQIQAALVALSQALSQAAADVTPYAGDLKVTAAKASQKTVTLVKGSTITLAGYGYTAVSKRVAGTWKVSGKAGIAKVNAKTGKIRAVKVGKTKVRFTAGGKSASVTVKVVAKKSSAKVKKVSATVPTKTLVKGQTMLVTGKYTPTKVTKVKVTYKSSNKAVFTVDKAGRVVAVAAGKAKLTVKAGGKSKSYTITVS